jgi:hypothetical protein
MTSSNTLPMKKQKKTKNLDQITFNVEQTKKTYFFLDYQTFKENYLTDFEYCDIDDDEFDKVAREIWQLVCKETDKHDEIELDDADCDDDVDEDYVCDASHDFIDNIVEQYKRTPRGLELAEESKKKHLEIIINQQNRLREEAEKKAKEEQAKKTKAQQIAELTAQLEKLRSS